MANFADRFKQLRMEAGWTQEELAAKLGVSKGAIGNYESGMRSPRKFEDLEAVADVFNVSFDYLLGRTNEKPEYSLEEQWIIQCYRRADQTVKDGIRSILRTYDEKNSAAEIVSA